MSGEYRDDIDRSEWVDLFEQGYKLGARERSRRPENRRDDVSEIVRETGTQAELEALQSGFDKGRKNAVPGAGPNIEEKANAAFDESGHAPSLSDWGGA